MYRERINEVSVISVLDTRKTKKSGKYPVRIQIINRNTQKYLSTGKELTKPEWEKLPQARNVEMVKTRECVKQIFDLVTKSVQELVSKGEYSFDRLCNLVGRTSGGTLNSSCKIKIQDLLEQGRVGTKHFYEGCLAAIEKYAGNNVPFENISVQWLNRFEAFMLNDGLSYATIDMRMRGIRTIMNMAKREGLIKEAQYPFGKGKYEIKTAVGRKKTLSLPQIAQIMAYDDGNPSTSLYRDIWVFIYLCNGINVADLVLLQYKDIVDGEIRFIRQKTKRTSMVKREIAVPVTPQMQAIIDRCGAPPSPERYIFDLIKHYKDPVRHQAQVQSILKRINKRMKRIGKDLGIGVITTYVARHSFATVLKRSGVSISYISESLGHSDLKTTENYLASFEQDVRKKNAELLTNFPQPVAVG